MQFIKLKVYPNSKKNRIIKKAQDSYEIWVKQKAKRGEANASVLKLLSDKTNIALNRLKIIKGANIPNKIVKIL
jgi:uncharacterized protein YggU (UPF0235/DUF167 family)